MAPATEIRRTSIVALPEDFADSRANARRRE
jgi:hypothetical protein